MTSTGARTTPLCAPGSRGRTGIDLVDAGMAKLWAIGWMHNRVRLVVAYFLTKNLRLHWRLGEEWFWDTLVDADDASNPFNWQWVAGTGDDPPPRTSASSTPSGSRNGSTPRVTTCVGGCPRWRTSPRSGWRRSSI